MLVRMWVDGKVEQLVVPMAGRLVVPRENSKVVQTVAHLAHWKAEWKVDW